MDVYTKWNQNGTCKEENKYKDTKSRHKYACIDIVTKSHAAHPYPNSFAGPIFHSMIQFEAPPGLSWMGIHVILVNKKH